MPKPPTPELSCHPEGAWARKPPLPASLSRTLSPRLCLCVSGLFGAWRFPSASFMRPNVWEARPLLSCVSEHSPFYLFTWTNYCLLSVPQLMGLGLCPQFWGVSNDPDGAGGPTPGVLTGGVSAKGVCRGKSWPGGEERFPRTGTFIRRTRSGHGGRGMGRTWVGAACKLFQNCMEAGREMPGTP